MTQEASADEMPQAAISHGDRSFLLEGHHYDGGLRVKPLGNSDRPPWVPPSDYVGFRNEIPLSHADAAVEFARFGYEGNQVTWIGVFRRSVDQVFGDRGNHAGVGVWLRDAEVLLAKNLLDALDLLAVEVSKGRIGDISGDAEAFADEFLPTYVRPTSKMFEQLSGWPYGTTALPETAFYLASGTTDDECWKITADHILRMQVLPPSVPNCSRALILVSQAAAAPESGASDPNLIRLKDGLALELVRYLPSAISGAAEQSQALAEQLRALSDTLQDRDLAVRRTAQELESARSEISDLQARIRSNAAQHGLEIQGLKDRIGELEQQISGDDLLRRLSFIDSALRTIDDRSDRIHSSVREIRADMSSFATRGTRSPEEVRTPAIVHHRNETQRSRRAGRRDNFWLYVGLFATVALLTALALWFFVWRS